eukprot:11166453-Lingulodinium_polyedra.AAC.1
MDSPAESLDIQVWLVQTMPPQASLQALTSSAAINVSLLGLACFQIMYGLLLCIWCGSSRSTAGNLTVTERWNAFVIR